MAPSAFNKLEKSVNDLLFKDFNVNTVKLESKKKDSTNSNVRLFAESNSSGSYSAKVEVSNLLPKHDAEFINTLSTGNMFTQEVKWTPHKMKGLEVKALVNFPIASQPVSSLLSARYAHCYLNACLEVPMGSVKQTDSLRLVPSLVLSHKGYTLGGTLKYSPMENSLLDYKGVLAYEGSNYMASFNYHNHNLGAKFHQKLNATTQVGVSANLTNRTFVMGGSHELSPTLNFKANLGSNNVFHGLWTHKYSNFLTVKVSTSFNISDVRPSFGLGIVYEG